MPAIIFDLDGTLLDVREGFYWQFQELTRQYDGAPVSKEEINAAAHGTTEQIVRTLGQSLLRTFAVVITRSVSNHTTVISSYMTASTSCCLYSSVWVLKWGR